MAKSKGKEIKERSAKKPKVEEEEDKAESESEDEATAVKKKPKVEEEEDEVESDSEDESKAVKVTKNDDGDSVFMLSDKRRCCVRKWKEHVLIDIREVYEKNGKTLPGKKGISLTLDQYKILRTLVKTGSIDEEIKQAGGKI